MSTTRLGGLPSLRRQHLLAEFAGLKQACPDGIFMSLTPGDPTLWSGVIFVRKGPYANAILRFQISFPDVYPSLPPLVTFSTDIFHPLITPISNYTYTTDISNDGTVSASDEERLPPGGFSLRHGFPDWFSRRRRPAPAPGSTAAPQTPTRPARSSSSLTPVTTPEGRGDVPGYMRTGAETEKVATYDVLWYIRSAFDDEDVLDSVPLEAAGNPGAWHAWRTHRKALGKVFEKELPARPAEGEGASEGGEKDGGAQAAASGARRPEEWNWDGVWEDRVKKGIAASLSEPVLYGGASGADDVIHFQVMEENEIETVKGNLIRTLGVTK